MRKLNLVYGRQHSTPSAGETHIVDACCNAWYQFACVLRVIHSLSPESGFYKAEYDLRLV